MSGGGPSKELLLIKEECEDWVVSPQNEGTLIVLLNVEGHDVQLLIDAEHEVTIHVPSGYPHSMEDVFSVDVPTALGSWNESLLEFIFENENITLPKILSKAVSLYKLRLKRKVQEEKPMLDGENQSGDEDEEEIEEDEVNGGVSSFPSSSKHFKEEEDDDDDDEEEEKGAFDFDDNFTTEWELQVVQMKKRWALKEEEVRKEMQKALKLASNITASMGEEREIETHAVKVTVAETKLANQIFSSSAASGILGNDLLKIIESQQRIGIRANAIDDNLYSWRVELFNFDPASGLADDMNELGKLFGYKHVELQVDFAMDLYPFYPPLVKIIRPRFKDSMMQRVSGLELLKLSYWNPAKDMTTLLCSIKSLLEENGRLEVKHEMNDSEKYPLGAYVPLEHHLLRLAMVSEVFPRANSRFQIAVEKAPVLKAPSPEKDKDKPATEKSGDKALASTEKKFWAAGTGYGHGSKQVVDWDPKAALAAQKEKDAQIERVIRGILFELEQYKLAFSSSSELSLDASLLARQAMKIETLASILEGSALVPFLEMNLCSDSFLEIQRHSVLFSVLFKLVSLLADEPCFAFLLDTLPHQKTSLVSLLEKQKFQIGIFLNRIQKASSSSITTKSQEEILASMIMSTSEHAIAEVQKYRKTIIDHNPSESEPNSSSSSLLHPASKEEKSVEEEYIAFMKTRQFDISDFAEGGSGTLVHHYKSNFEQDSAIEPKRITRIAQELSVLAGSLPLNFSSSVYVRVDEDRTYLLKVLITGPDDTPYSSGCFLFDVYFPPGYPQGPPKVNLQTTGNGAVRFNPNLYNCGKVCLSLLGTWEGRQGESWSAETSTFLQVLVSIQSLILVPEPFFNEPGYEQQMGTPSGIANSKAYNANIRIGTVRHAMLDQLRNPPPGFEEVVRAHFFFKKDAILKELRQWVEEEKQHVAGTVHSYVKDYSGGDSKALARLVDDLEAELKKLRPPHA